MKSLEKKQKKIFTQVIPKNSTNKMKTNFFTTMERKNLKLLDCTLRDGGYYNNWKFKIKDANKYLKQIYRAGVDVVEVGFNFFDKNSKYGKFAYANKELAKNLLNQIKRNWQS